MSVWRDSLGRLGGRAAPGAAGLWRWWTQALQSWLPPSWRRQLGLVPARLLLAPQARTLTLLHQHGDRLVTLAELPWPLSPQALDGLLQAPLDRLPRHWLLPPRQALRRRLRLPVAAAARLHDVARFEIDRQTPFAADQVYFDVSSRPSADPAFVDAELVVVPRRLLDGEDGIGEAWRGGLSGIDVAAEDGQPLRINLLPPAQRRADDDPQRRWNRLLLLASVLLIGVAGGLLLDNRRAAVDALQAQLQASSERARRVAGERQQLADLVEGAAFFDRQRAQRPTATEVWNELSQRLPNGTYLEKFSIEGSRLQLIGLSTEASALVRRLEGSRLWHTPSLTGVLQSDAGGGVDRFTITAELAGTDAQENADGDRR